MITTSTQLCSFAVLLGGPILFGLLSQPSAAGISMIAGAIGLAFVNIDKIKRFKGGGFEAEMKEKFEAMVAKEAEPERNQTEPDGIMELQVTAFDESIGNIIRALNSLKYTWRSIGGICQDTGMSREEVQTGLLWLESKGMVIHIGVGKRVNWGLTEQGREIANSI